MDFGVDVTNGMTRKGAVYPFAKSAAIGYGYGHRREEEFDGVCSQVGINKRVNILVTYLIA